MERYAVWQTVTCRVNVCHRCLIIIIIISIIIIIIIITELHTRTDRYSNHSDINTQIHAILSSLDTLCTLINKASLCGNISYIPTRVAETKACRATLWIKMTSQISPVKLSHNMSCTIIAHNYNTCPFKSCNHRICCFPYRAFVVTGVNIICDGHNLKNCNTILTRAILMGMSYETVGCEFWRFPKIGVPAWNFTLICEVKCTSSMEQTTWRHNATLWCGYEFPRFDCNP